MTELANVQPVDQILLGSATQPLSDLQQPEILIGLVRASSTPHSSSLY